VQLNAVYRKKICSIPIKYIFLGEAKCDKDRKMCPGVSNGSAWINSYLQDKITAFYCEHLNNI
jgi:hypothetical protein